MCGVKPVDGFAKHNQWRLPKPVLPGGVPPSVDSYKDCCPMYLKQKYGSNLDGKTGRYKSGSPKTALALYHVERQQAALEAWLSKLTQQPHGDVKVRRVKIMIKQRFPNGLWDKNLLEQLERIKNDRLAYPDKALIYVLTESLQSLQASTTSLRTRIRQTTDRISELKETRIPKAEEELRKAQEKKKQEAALETAEESKSSKNGSTASKKGGQEMTLVQAIVYARKAFPHDLQAQRDFIAVRSEAEREKHCTSACTSDPVEKAARSLRECRGNLERFQNVLSSLVKQLPAANKRLELQIAFWHQRFPEKTCPVQSPQQTSRTPGRRPPVQAPQLLIGLDR
jgi:hypothetical protein